MGDGSRSFAVVLGVAGALAFAVVIVNHLEDGYGFRPAVEAGDLARAQTALTRLTWIGNDSPRRRVQLGRRYARDSRQELAMREFHASLDLLPNAPAWRSIAQLHEENGDLQEAQQAYAMALGTDGRDVASLVGSGALWIRVGRSDRALPLLERAVSIEPHNPALAGPLLQARRNLGVAN